MPDMTKAVFLGTASSEEEVAQVVIPTAQTHNAKVPRQDIKGYNSPVIGIKTTSISVAAEGPNYKNFDKWVPSAVREKIRNEPGYFKTMFDRFTSRSDYEAYTTTAGSDRTGGRETTQHSSQEAQYNHYKRILTPPEDYGRISNPAPRDIYTKKIEFFKDQMAKRDPATFWGYWTASTSVLNGVDTSKAQVNVKEIIIPEKDAPVEIDPGKPENLPPMVKCRWIIRVR
jgi:hypothetical protein